MIDPVAPRRAEMPMHFDQAWRVRCASVAVQAISASTSDSKGEPPTFMAHRL
jgi:hypothetical protein